MGSMPAGLAPTEGGWQGRTDAAGDGLASASGARKLKVAELREKLERKRGMAVELAQQAQARADEQAEPRKSKKRRRRTRSSSDTSRSRSSDRARRKTPRELAESNPGRQMSTFLLEINK
eukprot:66556-Amphidinium_carterae.1